jgi:hypothetical protein
MQFSSIEGNPQRHALASQVFLSDHVRQLRRAQSLRKRHIADILVGE